MISGSLFPEDLYSFPRKRLADRLQQLARAGIYAGCSSWKYEGWLGQIYTPERYHGRGGFSRKRFASSCLAEYAETFPLVGGDFSFYQFPTPEYWGHLIESAPRSLQYGLKVPEEITVKRWPAQARYGPRAGQENPSFLSAELFETQLVDALAAYREQVAVLMLEFGAFSRQVYRGVQEFLRELDEFLELVKGRFRLAVEIRNPEFLGSEYFGCLREHGVAHVLNSWTRMPPLGEQLRMPGVWTADFAVSRALLRPGRSYEAAVDRFAPYREVQDPQPEVRQTLRDLISICQEEDRAAFLFVNHRLEGNAPGTILSVVSE
jgi:uncharacterized protein YecE (DUF72 family)